MNALVFCEKNGSDTSGFKRSSLELLSHAQRLGLKTTAVCVGSDSQKLSEEASQYGAEKLVLLPTESFGQYNPELFLQAFDELVKKTAATALLASSSSLGRDLFPRLAARLKSPILTDAIGLVGSGSAWQVKRAVYSGKAYLTSALEGPQCKIVLMRPNQLEVNAPTAAKTIPVETVAAPSASHLMTSVLEVVQGASKKLDLTEANVIVSGGRGLKDAANFAMLNDLAEVLGGTVGASRAVVDAGWVSHSMQVGQTGKTVAPSLYFAIGISGAIQHLAGMSGSKVIVAINNDANAPIFQKATYGIVGDLFTIVPQLTAEFKKALNK